MGHFAGDYAGQLSGVEIRAQNLKEQMSASEVKASEETVELLRKKFDDEMKLLESSITFAKISLGATHVIFVAMVLLTSYTFFKGLPDRLTMLPLAVWLDQYATRLFAMCTKEEARELAVLELKVMDEESLRGYLSRLSQLAVKYDFPLLTQVGSWLIESERRRAEGLT